jgi:hypothetical protein
MGGIPGIGKNGQDKAEQVFWQTSDIALDSFTNSNTTGMKINVKNNLREGITIDSFSLDNSDILSTPPGVYIETGEAKALPLIAVNVPGCIKGQTFSYNVEINYTTASGHSYTFSGFGHKMTGMCAN